MGRATDADATDALSGFRRFPQWMWRNADVLDFVGWLREFNDGQPDVSRKVGFYGLDLYSMHASMAAVLAYLDRVDPAAAARARERYACFEYVGGDDPQAYGQATALGLSPTASAKRSRSSWSSSERPANTRGATAAIARDALFFAEQNARLVRNAERYYRAMFADRVLSWNLRDQHMAETLGELALFLGREANAAKIVVWAHNSHLGDARATEMGGRGELNVGQLVRARAGAQRPSWSASPRMRDRNCSDGLGRSGRTQDASGRHCRVATRRCSTISACQTSWPNFAATATSARSLAEARLERAIGVIYRPETERQSHYFYARLPDQFDAILHYDTTRAVEPLARTGRRESPGEPPETYPRRSSRRLPRSRPMLPAPCAGHALHSRCVATGPYTGRICVMPCADAATTAQGRGSSRCESQDR